MRKIEINFQGVNAYQLNNFLIEDIEVQGLPY